MSKNLECPIDFVTINENQARLNALQVLLLTIVWLFTGVIIIPAFLAVDFALRAFNLGKYSLLNNISGFTIKQFSIKHKPVDRGPKRFAALIGLFFTAAITLLAFFELNSASKILASVLLLFASLEAFVGFCAGCYVYTFFIRFFKKPANQ